MLIKIKQITFFLVIYSFLAFSLAWAETAEKKSFIFAENNALESALWNIGAYFTPSVSLGADGIVREHFLPATNEFPPALIKLTYSEALRPFPTSITMHVWAEADKRSQLFYLEDKIPFGGENLILKDYNVKNFSSHKLLEGSLAISELDIFLDYLHNFTLRLEGKNKIKPFQWQEVVEGFEVAKSEVFFGLRFGNNDIYVAKINPNFFTIKPYHETQTEAWAKEPANIKAWASRLNEAIALINGGQYYPDRSYMGLLKKSEFVFSEIEHKSWQGFLVADPLDKNNLETDILEIDIIDKEMLKNGDLQPEDYNSVLQSFMLIDSLGRIRVKNTMFLASRTAIAIDKDNNILFIMLPGAISLYDFATLLLKSDLKIKKALGLDGGFEAQLMLRQNLVPFIATGSFSISPERPLFAPGYSSTLPAVLAVEPK